MEALVLGGSRFVGLRLVQLLHAEGHTVTVLNRGATPTELPEGVATIRADREKPSEVAAALRGRTFDAAFDTSAYVAKTLKPAVEAAGRQRRQLRLLQHDRGVREVGTLPDQARLPAGEIAGRQRLPEGQGRLRGPCCARPTPAAASRSPYCVRRRCTARTTRCLSGSSATSRGRSGERRSSYPATRPPWCSSPTSTTWPPRFSPPPLRTGASATATRYAASTRSASTTGPAPSGAPSVRPVDVGLRGRGPGSTSSTASWGSATPAIWPFGWGRSFFFSIDEAKRDLGWSPRHDIGRRARDDLPLVARPGPPRRRLGFFGRRRDAGASAQSRLSVGARP